MWWLKNEAMWRPSRCGYRHVSERDIGRMTLGQVTTLVHWSNKMRKAEFDAYKRDADKARDKARTPSRRR